MLFVTWNVNSLRARLPRVLELLEFHQPDVVALQETKCSRETFPAAELDEAGYEAIHSSGGQWAGVALLARQPLSLEDPVLGLPGDSVPAEARWCEASVEAIRFVSTYVPNGRTLESPEYPRKLEFLAAATERVAALRTQEPERGLLLAGDINIAPADADVYDPAAYVGSTHVSEPERTALTTLIDQGGRLLPGAGARRDPVHMVGLPRRKLSQEHRDADRSRADQPRAGRSTARLLDRPGLSQGAQALRSCPASGETRRGVAVASSHARTLRYDPAPL